MWYSMPNQPWISCKYDTKIINSQVKSWSIVNSTSIFLFEEYLGKKKKKTKRKTINCEGKGTPNANSLGQWMWRISFPIPVYITFIPHYPCNKPLLPILPQVNWWASAATTRGCNGAWLSSYTLCDTAVTSLRLLFLCRPNSNWIRNTSRLMFSGLTYLCLLIGHNNVFNISQIQIFDPPKKQKQQQPKKPHTHTHTHTKKKQQQQKTTNKKNKSINKQRKEGNVSQHNVLCLPPPPSTTNNNNKKVAGFTKITS